MLALKDNLRTEDLAEVQAADLTPAEAVGRSWAVSDECWTAFIDGQVGAMFGVRKLPTGHGLIWLLGTDRLATIAVTFARESKQWIEYLLDNYGGQVENIVYEGNTLHMRWLDWLGAEFQLPPQAGIRNFIGFKIRRK